MVSDEDRRRFVRQAAALATAESDDEGTLEWRYWMIEDANERRAAKNIPPLKTEGELHRRAKSLGLLD